LNSIQKVNVELAFGVQGEMQTAAGQIAWIVFWWLRSRVGA
jgi:hypothetical protein